MGLVFKLERYGRVQPTGFLFSPNCRIDRTRTSQESKMHKDTRQDPEVQSEEPRGFGKEAAKEQEILDEYNWNNWEQKESEEAENPETQMRSDRWLLV